MTKTIDTLINDMENVLLGLGGWNAAITKYLAEGISEVAEARFSKPQEPRGYLSLSGIGNPCDRDLWYKVNKPEEGLPLPAKLYGNFFYGDLLEVFILALVRAAGHTVEGEQDKLDVHGVKGHRDAVIDGVTVDVKSASSYGFLKFANGSLRVEDPYGYVSQLSSYVYAGKDDPLVKDKNRGAFLAVNKNTFDLALDVYDFTDELDTKEQEIEAKKALVAGPLPEERLPPIVQAWKGKGVDREPTNGNMKLAAKCANCSYRKLCWPGARTFLYSNGPVYLTTVDKEPNVTELID